MCLPERTSSVVHASIAPSFPPSGMDPTRTWGAHLSSVILEVSTFNKKNRSRKTGRLASWTPQAAPHNRYTVKPERSQQPRCMNFILSTAPLLLLVCRPRHPLSPQHSPVALPSVWAPKEKAHCPWSVLAAPHYSPCPLPRTGRASRVADQKLGAPTAETRERPRAPTKTRYHPGCSANAAPFSTQPDT